MELQQVRAVKFATEWVAVLGRGPSQERPFT